MKIFPTHLTNDALMSEVLRLARDERAAVVQLITHLAEVERRGLQLKAGHSSLYTYCRVVLRFSEPEAYIRMKAARAVRRFPRILAMLADGSLTLTTLRLLIPRLNASNHESLLAAAAGKSKREVLERLAGLFPVPDVPASVRKLPAPADVVIPPAVAQLNGESQAGEPSVGPPTAAPSASPGGFSDVVPVVMSSAPDRPLAAATPPPRRPLVAPLATDRYQITFTASTETRDKLEFARDLLRHAVPDGDPAAIFDRALTALLRELARKKFAAADKPRAGRGDLKHSRYIPARVKRAVWVRDLGRCAFVAADGRRCGERGFVEFHHHDDPYGVGGEATVENIQLRCRAHNRYEADVYYGRGLVEGFVRESAPVYGGLTTVSGPSCVSDTQLRSAAGAATARARRRPIRPRGRSHPPP